MKLRLDKQARRVSKREMWLLWLGAFCIAILLLPSFGLIKVLMIQGGYRNLHTDPQDRLMQVVNDVAQVPNKLISAERSHPVIRLDIKYKEFQKLAKDRQQALQAGRISDSRRTAKGTLLFKRKNYKVDLRLQGDMLDHVVGSDRWSLRVDIKKGKALFSTSRFALISSSVRAHQGPELFRQTMETAGFDIIAPRHIPVRVIVNGDDWGIMLVEQAFGQDLLAVNNRTEGLVVRLDLLDEAVDRKGERHRELKPRVIQQNTILKKLELSRQRQIALSLISDFIDGKRPASDVFDVEKLGQYLATVDVWAAWHALTWNNWRWYYNPHTARFEPIQSDVAVSPAKHFWLMKKPTDYSLISQKMLADQKVVASYHKALDHLKSLIDSGELIQALDEQQQLFNKNLYASSPMLGDYDFGLMKQQAECLGTDYEQSVCSSFRELGSDLHIPMQAMSVTLPWEIMADYSSSASGAVLSISNPGQDALKLMDIHQVNPDGSKSRLDNAALGLPMSVEVDSNVTVAVPGKPQHIEVRVKHAGKTRLHHFTLDTDALSFIPRPEISDVLKAYPFIKPGQQRWVIQPGRWKINDYLVTPDNWKVVVQPGTRLEFSEGSGLMVFGGVQIKGTSQKPVEFTSQADDRHWSGMTVIGRDAIKSSQVDHLEVSKARSPKLGFWQPRGAVYFVNSIVDIDHLSIYDNASEDALNIINSDIDIRRLNITNALSDGFDCDFCEGTVRDSQFVNIGSVSGGDGIDTSGSALSISNSRFDGIRDKAISAGEFSRLTVDNSIVENSNIAIVAKDRSEVTASNVRLDNIKEYSLMSYTKKPIFGPATLEADDIDCVSFHCASHTLVESGSTLLIDGESIGSEDVNVKALYQGIMKSDKPK